MSDYQDRDYEEVCILCRRPESKAGRMFHLPNNIAVCDDCMHKTMETMSHMDMNGMFPGMGMVPPSFMKDMQKEDFHSFPSGITKHHIRPQAKKRSVAGKIL